MVADSKLAYSVTMAPLVIKDIVIVGTGGGEYGIRGFIAAYDVRTGKEVWRFNAIPAPGEPGSETWEGDDWEHGGASVWVTGSYDPELNLTYWGIGNPGPDWNPDQRPGDNLYSDSVVALDADTGELKWHFQFTPNDAYDYDAVQVPVLVDIEWRGAPRKLMLWANRNGFFYVLDRATGEFLQGTPFVKVNWASGLDANGRPIQTPQPPGAPTWPGNQGGTNWYSPSFSPRTGLFYLSAWVDYASYFRREHQEFELGRNYAGGGHRVVTPVPDSPGVAIGRRTPINNWTDAVAHGEVIALDPRTGQQRWSFRQYDVTDSGIMTTATDLLFTGGREGYFHALDARTGELLWKASLGGQIVNAPVSYEIDGKQYIATISGNNLVAFALARLSRAFARRAARTVSARDRRQRRLAGGDVLVDGDRVEAADRVGAHDGDEIHRALGAVELLRLRERRRAHLAVVQQLAAEADDGGVGFVDARQRTVGSHDVDDLLATPARTAAGSWAFHSKL